jgi:1-acyl-sn-glycerol-3-phosphate acyltransferase
MGNVKRKSSTSGRENFSGTCVLIANHQSFPDILVMTMLNPKIILLTNDWVWNSPYSADFVRIAGYYPVSRGIENGISIWKNK